MYKSSITPCIYLHQFNQEKKVEEKRTLIVIIITFITMGVEIIAGWFFKSMALFADGWHMSTHVTALMISLIAYILARRYAKDPRFTFGTWKIEILGAYTSAILLGCVAIYVIGGSIYRILNPSIIDYNGALLVAVIGLAVNIISALILQSPYSSQSRHLNYHEHIDVNLKSAYFHVLADALTSFLAIFALIFAKYFNWNRLDPFIGIIGGILITKWAYSLFKEVSEILLDKQHHIQLNSAIQDIIESDGETKVTDLHLWRIRQNKYACIISIATKNTLEPQYYKDKIKSIDNVDFAHMTVETSLYKKVNN